MTSDRDEEIAASIGAHRDLGSGYDEAIASGLVERIGAEIDRRVDERVSEQQHQGTAAKQGSQHLPTVHGGPITWQQAILALGSMVVGLIASAALGTDHGNGTWPIIVIWLAIVVINLAVLRRGRPHRDQRSQD